MRQRKAKLPYLSTSHLASYGEIDPQLMGKIQVSDGSVRSVDSSQPKVMVRRLRSAKDLFVQLVLGPTRQGVSR